MKNAIYKITILIVGVLVSILSYGQKAINQLEYWTDGNTSARVLRALTPATSYSWLEQVDVAALSDGVHSLNVRFRDDGGVWSNVQSRFILKQNSAAGQGTLRLVNAMEYWTDGNTAQKNQRTLTPSASYNWAEQVDVASLSDGVHTLNVRFRDDGGVWSNVQSRFILKQNSAAGQGTLRLVNAMEYWTDGNTAQKTQRTLTPVASHTWTELVDVASLTDGVHMLNVRFRDDGGVWSNVQSRFILKQNTAISQGTDRKLTRLEYWTDENATARVKRNLQTAENYIWQELVDLPALKNGLHTLNVRLQDDGGVWSNVQSRFFIKNNEDMIPAGENKITGYRIWYSADKPTLFDSYPATSTAPETNIVQDINADYVPTGKHQVSFQVKDSRGVWSPIIIDSVSQAGNALFSFTADKRDIRQLDTVRFTPSTLHFIDKLVWNFGDGKTEVNYQPEHVYDSIGQFDVAATVWHYGATEGKNYVEVKYITVAPTGISTPEVYTVKMFPVPVTDQLTIESSDSPIRRVRVLTINGTIVKDVLCSGENTVNISLGELASGTYIVVTTTANSNLSGKMLKK